LVGRPEAPAVVADLGEDLRRADPSRAEQRRDDLAVGVRFQGVLDGASEGRDLRDQWTQNCDERTHAFTVGFSFELARSAERGSAQSLEQLTRGATAAVGVPRDERDHAFLPETRCRLWRARRQVDPCIDDNYISPSVSVR
jgi:hypothetical protein